MFLCSGHDRSTFAFLLYRNAVNAFRIVRRPMQISIEVRIFFIPDVFWIQCPSKTGFATRGAYHRLCAAPWQAHPLDKLVAPAEIETFSPRPRHGWPSFASRLSHEHRIADRLFYLRCVKRCFVALVGVVAWEWWWKDEAGGTWV